MTSIQQRRMVTLFAVILSTCVGTAAESQNGDWSSYSPPPPPRYDHVAIYDPNQDRMVIFAGAVEPNFPLAAYSMPLGTAPAWAPLVPSGFAPAVDYGLRGVYDTNHGRLVLTAANGNDFLWFMSLTGTPAWSNVYPEGTWPPAPANFTLTYDPVRDRALLIGGIPYFTYFATSDVWELSLGATPTWTLLGTTGSPPPGRRAHCAIYDPVRDRVVVFGGNNGSGNPFIEFNDVWQLSLSTPTPQWTQIITSGTPPPTRGYSAAIYDPVRDRMVVFGGQHTAVNTQTPTNDTWALDLGTGLWTQLTPSSPPPTRYGHSAIYDPMRDRMVIFGGRGSQNERRAETYFLTWGTPLAVQDRWTDGRQPGVTSAPNPSIQGTSLRFSLGEAGVVNLSIVDAEGRIVRGFPAQPFPAGECSVPWDGRRDDGSPAASGVYFVRVEAKGMAREGKIVLTR